MAFEVPATRRLLVPIVPRKFERKAHTATSSISDLSVTSAAVESQATTATAESPQPVELPSHQPEVIVDTPPTEEKAKEREEGGENDAGNISKAQNESASVLHRSRPSLALNITFGDLPPPPTQEDHTFQQSIQRQETVVESHISSPTVPPSGSTTSYTHPTPFSEAENKNPGAEQPLHQENGRIANAYEEVPHAILSERGEPAHNNNTKASTFIPHANGNPSSVGAFNPVVNGVPLVHNLLLSFKDSLFSDIDLELEASGQLGHIQAHSVIVQMLPPLRDILMRTGITETGRKSIRLSCPNPYATVAALEAIIRMPYGGSLPRPARASLSAAPDVMEWAKLHTANLAAATFLKFTEVADLSADCLIPLMERDLNITMLVLECVYADRTEFDHDAPPGHYRDPIKNGRFYHFKIFEAAKSAILSNMTSSSPTSGRRTLNYSAPPASLLGGLPPALNPVNTGASFGHRPVLSGVSMGDVFLGPDETATTLSRILLSVPIGFLNLLTRDPRAELMLGAAVKEREDRRKAFVLQHGIGRHLPDRARWEERLEFDGDDFPVVNRYEVIRF